MTGRRPWAAVGTGLLLASLAGCGTSAASPGPVASHRAGPASSPSPSRSPETQQPVAVPQPGRTFFGITTPLGPYDLSEYDAAAASAGKAPSVLLFPQGWAKDDPDLTLLQRVSDRGVLPMIGWEPWDYAAPSAAARLEGAQPAYALQHILDGDFDDYVRHWADALRDFRRPVALRFAHEMNGRWYPWAEDANGNRPGQYVAAWRHVHDLFTAAGATNVRWVWSPNIAYPGSHPLAELYPGDAYVDWLGVVGYDGRAQPGPAPSFDDVFGQTLATLRTLSARPIVITETAGTEQSGHKPAWVHAFFAGLAAHPEVVGFIWFDIDKETDWRWTSSEPARAAFAAEVAAERYQPAG